MKGKWKRILILIAALAAIALIATALRPSPLRVETARVERGQMTVTVDAEGKTRVHDRFVVAAPVPGQLNRIDLHRGDYVRQNEIIARIEPLPLPPLDPRQLAEARARVAAAEQRKNESDVAIERIRADCDQARREYDRAQKLVETGDLAKQEFERIRNAEQTCRQQLQAARFNSRASASEVDVAKAALIAIEQAGQSGKSAVVSVRAPVGGRVLRLIEESERVVTAGTPLIELSGQTLEIVIDVLSTDAVKIKPGARVQIEGWGGGQVLPATVRLVEPSATTKVSSLGIEEQRVNVIADFVEYPSQLGDGYRVEARVVVWEQDQALRAPASALFRRGTGWSVFVVEDGKARLREVEPGQRTAYQVEILKGLRDGEEVILHPANQIVSGARVAVDAVKQKGD